ncbi:MAG: PHP domain-containing protein [Epulopiscium sp.]|nr:PHP domain-containing protein [Candidatus Epulonipiscium sp.]
MKICLHIHSRYSHDSDVSVKDIIHEAERLGYDVISITDHNTVKGSLEALEYKDSNVSIIPGAEFSTEFGHVLAYFIDDSIEKNTPKIDEKRFDFFKLVENIRSINGVIILAHPFNSKLKEHMEILNSIDGIERYNARLDSFYFKNKSNSFIKPLLNRKNFIYLGGPDAHSLEELSHCYTITKEFSLDPEAFKKALFNQSIVYYKTSVNYAISKAKIHNIKKFKPKHIVKNIIRMMYGILEIVYTKVLRCRQYEIIYIGKESKP